MIATQPITINAASPHDDLRAGIRHGCLCLSSATPEGVCWIEAAFPDGQWEDDGDGRPWYSVSRRLVELHIIPPHAY